MSSEQSLIAIQHRLVLENMQRDPDAMLSESEIAGILNPSELADYKLAVVEGERALDVAQGKLASASPEALAFWDAALVFWVDCFKVWMMLDRNKMQRDAKLAAEIAVREKHRDVLAALIKVVPDTAIFYHANMHETFDVGSIPGVVIATKARERRDRARDAAIRNAKRKGKPIPQPLVFNYSFYLIQTALEQNSDLLLVPWPQQVAALERHFGVPPVPDNDVGEALAPETRFLKWGDSLAG